MQGGKLLVYLGLSLVAAGLFWMLGSRLGLGRLPGDIVVQKKNTTFYFPIVTSIIVSVVLGVLLNLFRK